MSAKDIKTKEKRRNRAKLRLRRSIRGTNDNPRICVFRSSRFTYAQVISDESGKTLASVSTKEKSVIDKAAQLAEEGNAVSTKSVVAAKALGVCLAEKLNKQGITSAVFDRNGFRYQGRVKHVADGIREGGFKL